MGLERGMMRFKRERLVGSWRRLREERVADNSGHYVHRQRCGGWLGKVQREMNVFGEEIWWRKKGVFRSFRIMGVLCRFFKKKTQKKKKKQ
jgi:hypothetical protein